MKKILLIGIVVFIILCIAITLNTFTIGDLKSKVADQQIIIEELVKYTGYDINSDCITTDGKLYRELCELAKWVQDHQQILETLKTNFESCYIINHWQGLRIDVNEEWLKEIREVLKDDLPEAILDDLPKAISQKRGRE